MKAIIINGPMGVGNRETKTMAIDNILHMIGNYRKCSICKRILLVWLMNGMPRNYWGHYQPGIRSENCCLSM